MTWKPICTIRWSPRALKPPLQVDADGVALVAIQALYHLLQAKEVEITDLQRQVNRQQEQIEALQRQNAELELRLQRLEQALTQVTAPSE